MMKDLIGCVMDIGEQMLLCGAEVHRVEDSIERMCHAFEAERVDVFIITSSMVVTVFLPSGEKLPLCSDWQQWQRKNHPDKSDPGT